MEIRRPNQEKQNYKKWDYKVKAKSDRLIECCKAILVTKCYTQECRLITKKLLLR